MSLTADGSPPDGIAADWDWEEAQGRVDPFQGAPEPVPSAPSNDGLLREIARLDSLANDLKVPISTRKAAAEWRDFFKREKARNEFISEVAEITKIRALFEPLPDSELAKWISEGHEVGRKGGGPAQYRGHLRTLRTSHPRSVRSPYSTAPRGSDVEVRLRPSAGSKRPGQFWASYRVKNRELE